MEHDHQGLYVMIALMAVVLLVVFIMLAMVIMSGNKLEERMETLFRRMDDNEELDRVQQVGIDLKTGDDRSL